MHILVQQPTGVHARAAWARRARACPAHAQRLGGVVGRARRWHLVFCTFRFAIVAAVAVRGGAVGPSVDAVGRELVVVLLQRFGRRTRVLGVEVVEVVFAQPVGILSKRVHRTRTKRAKPARG